MPQQFEGLGLSLLYPDSWTLIEEGTEGGTRGVNLESPGGSFLSINVYDMQADPADVIAEATEAMEAEYDEIESEPLQVTVADQQLHGTVQRFYYLDFVIVSKIIAVPHGEQMFLVQIQGEDRDIEQNERVFEAILTSMLRSLAHG
jgi:hypothetical protein